MKSVALHNLGCKVNSYEIDVMQQMLQEKGYTVVSFDEKADIYIVNTCSVTNIADRKSRQMLHKAKKMNPEAIVVATGCYVQTGKEILDQDPSIDIVIGNNRKNEIANIIEDYRREKQVTDTVIDINQTDEYEEMNLTQTADHTRAYIKIQDGCNQFCSYCIIPYARGRVRSRSTANILKEIEGLVAAGYKEIVLTGIHISSYGTDFVKKGTEDYLNETVKDLKVIAQRRGYLVDLIKQIHQVDGLERIRIGSLEPRIITEEFASTLSKMPKICPHFHLSLQSGCDTTLGRMNRHYTVDEYYEKVCLLRRFFMHPAITTDVIVGFPGESEEEFQITKEFLKKIKFYEMHIFKYSKRQGTKAAVMKNQIPDPVKTFRSNALLEMEREHSQEFRDYYIGREEEVLFEEVKELNGKQYWVGHTKQYIKAAVSCEEDLSNKIRRGRIEKFLSGDIMLIKLF